MRLLAVPLTLLLFVAGCMEYVPANLPLQLESAPEAEAGEYRDEMGRTIGDAEADGPEYRLTMANGTQFFMKSPRIVGDSVLGFYRPQKSTPWARISVPLYDVRLAEQQRIDWLATSSLLVAPITLLLLLTN